MAAFACPACRGDLAFSLQGARCEGCGAAYPKITSETYLLAGRSKEAMLREGLRWSAQQVDIHRDRLNVLDSEQWRPASWDATRLKLQLALSHNLSIYHSINAKLVELSATLDTEINDKRSPVSKTYNDFGSYLAKDWSDDPRSGREARFMAELLADALSRFDGGRGSSLVLGAGLARLATELHPFIDNVYALDNSIIAAILFDMLKDGFSLHHEHFSNAISADSQIRLMEHALTEQARQALGRGGVRYVVADAMATPFADASMGSVMSVYFTDVIGLDAILPEAKRVLETGGLFIHFGPLRYHFADRRRMYPVEALRQIVAQLGFQILEDRFVPVTTGRIASEMMATTYRNWLLVARKS